MKHCQMPRRAAQTPATFGKTHTRLLPDSLLRWHTISALHTHFQTHTFLCDRQFHSVVAEVLAYKKQCWYDLMGESYYKTVAGPV